MSETDDLPKLGKKVYEKELARLQLELIKLQEWIKGKGLKVVVIFEGHDAAGKGGTIKWITENLKIVGLQLMLTVLLSEGKGASTPKSPENGVRVVRRKIRLAPT